MKWWSSRASLFLHHLVALIIITITMTALSLGANGKKRIVKTSSSTYADVSPQPSPHRNFWFVCYRQCDSENDVGWPLWVDGGCVRWIDYGWRKKLYRSSTVCFAAWTDTVSWWAICCYVTYRWHRSFSNPMQKSVEWQRGLGSSWTEWSVPERRSARTISVLSLCGINGWCRTGNRRAMGWGLLLPQGMKFCLQLGEKTLVAFPLQLPPGLLCIEPVCHIRLEWHCCSSNRCDEFRL